jgi:hypothetical protein
MNYPVTISSSALPALVAAAGDRAQTRFWKFFVSNIRNPHTRRAYGRSIAEFLAWCEQHGMPQAARTPAFAALCRGEFSELFHHLALDRGRVSFMNLFVRGRAGMRLPSLAAVKPDQISEQSVACPRISCLPARVFVGKLLLGRS